MATSDIQIAANLIVFFIIASSLNGWLAFIVPCTGEIVEVGENFKTAAPAKSHRRKMYDGAAGGAHVRGVVDQILFHIMLF